MAAASNRGTQFVRGQCLQQQKSRVFFVPRLACNHQQQRTFRIDQVDNLCESCDSIQLFLFPSECKIGEKISANFATTKKNNLMKSANNLFPNQIDLCELPMFLMQIQIQKLISL